MHSPTNSDLSNNAEAAYSGKHKDWLLCKDCDQVQALAQLVANEEQHCIKCNAVIYSRRGPWLNLAITLSASALCLFVLSLFYPILTLEIGSQSQSITILDGFWALLERNNFILAALIISTLFLFPLFEITAFLYLLLPYLYRRHIPGQSAVLRWLNQAKNWSMLEVFLVGMVVASIKMADMAILSLELGAYALFLLVTMLILAHLRIDRKKLWAWINPNNYFTRAIDEEITTCRACDAMIGRSVLTINSHCPRCGSEVHERIPKSLQKTTALTLAAAVLYIPANTLPIMTYSTLGEVGTDTIISGVIALVAADLWGIALIIFIASVAVPVIKLLILIYLICAVQFKWIGGEGHRALLYRVTEFIGRWSMVDVFVVTIFVALVQFGFVYTVEAEGAIVAFGAVVVLTMVAAETFDPRLIWDAHDHQKRYVQLKREERMAIK